MSEDFAGRHNAIVEQAVELIAKQPIADGGGVDEVLGMVFQGASRRLAADRAARQGNAKGET